MFFPILKWYRCDVRALVHFMLLLLSTSGAYPPILGCVWIRGCGRVESWGWVGVEVWRKCEESWGCLDWGMLEWMCEESLLEIVSDVIVVRIL